MWRLKLAPNLNFDRVYGTAGTASNQMLGAYSALPMGVRKLLLTVPSMFPENESYAMLISTQFLLEY